MTAPTKSICPLLLVNKSLEYFIKNFHNITSIKEDYRKITVDRYAVQNFFKAEDIKACMKKVRTVNLHEICHVDDELQIKGKLFVYYNKIGISLVIICY